MKKHWLIVLIACDALLVLAHVLWGRELQIFNLDRERTPAAYYSGAKLAFIASVAFFATILTSERREKILWMLLGIFFIGLSFDEISELHENVTYYISYYVHPSQFFRSPTYMWLVFLSPLIISGMALLVILIRRLAKTARSAQAVFVAGLFFFCAALGLEFLSGAFRAAWFIRLSPVIEEASEMLGATCFAYGVFSLVRHRFFQQFQRKK